MATTQSGTAIVKVFVSHDSRDTAIVKAFHDLLIDSGLFQEDDDNLFISSIEEHGTDPGQYWMPNIGEHLATSSIVIPIITPAFRDNEWCLYEIGGWWALSAVLGQGKYRVFPFRVSVDPESLPKAMRPIQANKFSETSLNKLGKLIAKGFALTAGSDGWKEHPTCDKEKWEKHVKQFLTELPTAERKDSAGWRKTDANQERTAARAGKALDDLRSALEEVHHSFQDASKARQIAGALHEEAISLISSTSAEQWSSVRPRPLWDEPLSVEDVLNDLQTLHGHGHSDLRSNYERVQDLFDAAVSVHVKRCLEYAAKAFQTSSGHKVRVVTVKELTSPLHVKRKHDVDSFLVQDLCRNVGNLRPPDPADTVGGNTNFKRLIEDDLDCIHVKDVTRQARSRRGYRDSHRRSSGNRYSYRSTVIWAIRPPINRNVSSSKDGSSVEKWVGFLTVDSKDTNAFGEMDEKLGHCIAKALFPPLSILREIPALYTNVVEAANALIEQPVL
ncbi:MAG: toll/interleukin-1 receptor domain-containing protein [Propionibacteriaceae bacterium]|jgi:hypothetical protein|nr:toll/interleukin-1 receptor domain-containing protein [Propionibacteriaceae bacterium]